MFVLHAATLGSYIALNGQRVRSALAANLKQVPLISARTNKHPPGQR